MGTWSIFTIKQLSLVIPSLVGLQAMLVLVFYPLVADVLLQKKNLDSNLKHACRLFVGISIIESPAHPGRNPLPPPSPPPFIFPLLLEFFCQP